MEQILKICRKHNENVVVLFGNIHPDICSIFLYNYNPLKKMNIHFLFWNTWDEFQTRPMCSDKFAVIYSSLSLPASENDLLLYKY